MHGKTKIFRSATGEQAPRLLTLKCEPHSATQRVAEWGVRILSKRKRGMLLGVRIVLIVPHSTNRNEQLLATQIPRILCASWYAVCLRYANPLGSSPLTVI